MEGLIKRITKQFKQIELLIKEIYNSIVLNEGRLCFSTFKVTNMGYQDIVKITGKGRIKNITMLVNSNVNADSLNIVADDKVKYEFSLRSENYNNILTDSTNGQGKFLKINETINFNQYFLLKGNFLYQSGSLTGNITYIINE